MPSPSEKIRDIISGMKAGTYERDEVLALSLLSALSGESIFLLGLPGTGKSMIARRLKRAFTGASAFEYLMSRFSTPDEIFGPVSISKLKDSDCYERVTAGYLPEADIVFLDEIWKAGPAIQNSLLTVLNEKIYLNGNQELHLPLKGTIAASNELPAKGEGLEALWDRFLIRYIVPPIEQKCNFMRLLAADDPQEEPVQNVSLSEAEYMSIQSESHKIMLPEQVAEVIYEIRRRLNEYETKHDSDSDNDDRLNYYISDRRWKKTAAVLRTSAYLNGRREVDFSDAMLLAHMLWNEEQTIPTVREIVAETIVNSRFKNILDQLKSYKRHAASAAKNKDNRLYSPDGHNYVIQCDESPLKIAIKDYNMIRNNPDGVYFGSETTDNRIIIKPRGGYVIRFIKEGYLCINSYNYALRTINDEQLTERFLNDLDDAMDNIANELYKELDQNMFMVSSDLHKYLQGVIAIYKKRLQTM